MHGHWLEIQEHADGSLTVQFGTANLEWATAWVLEPPELAARVRAAARATARRYEEG